MSITDSPKAVYALPDVVTESPMSAMKPLQKTAAVPTPPTSPPPPTWLLISLLIACQITNAGWCIVGSYALSGTTGVSAPAFVALRTVLSVMVLAFAAHCREGHSVLRTPPWRPHQPVWNQPIVWAGVCGGAGMPLLYLNGLMLTSPTVAAVWDGPLLPVVVCVLSRFFWTSKSNAHQTLRQWLSLLLTVAAAAMVLLAEHHHHKHAQEKSTKEFVYGNVILLGMVVSAAAMNLSQKAVASYYPYPISLTCWMFAIGAMINVLYVVCMTRIPRWDEIHVDSWFVFGLFYAAVILQFSFTTISYASRYLDSSVVTLFCALQPCLTALVDYHRLTPTKCTGMVLVIVGMYGFTASKLKTMNTEGRDSLHHEHTV